MNIFALLILSTLIIAVGYGLIKLIGWYTGSSF